MAALCGAACVLARVGAASAVAAPFVYVTNQGSDSVSQFGTAGSVLSALTPPTVGAGVFPFGVAITPDGRHAYVTDAFGDSVSQYAINPDGTLTSQGTTPTGNGPVWVAVTPHGRHAYVTNALGDNVSQYTINADGTLTSQGTTPAGDRPSGIAITPSRGPSGWPRLVVGRLSRGAVDAVGGQTITILGENVSDGSQVFFGDTPAAHMTLHRFDRITATTPALQPGVLAVRVVTPRRPQPRHHRERTRRHGAVAHHHDRQAAERPRPSPAPVVVQRPRR